MTFKQNIASSRLPNAPTELPFFTEKDLADRWRLSIKTLQKWRLVGGGPAYVKLNGRAVRYPIDSVREFETRDLMTHTSSTSPAAAGGATVPSPAHRRVGG